MTTPRGRSLHECFAALSNTKKRHRIEAAEEFTATKRSRVIAELSPFFLPTSQCTQDAAATMDAVASSKETAPEISEKAVAKADGAEVESLTLGAIEYLKKQKKFVADDMGRIEGRRNTMFSKAREVWGVYRYGLETISRLTDLRDAPDALLPGNF